MGMARTPDGKIITSQRTICFLTHSDIGGFSRDKTFAEKENGEDITLIKIKKTIAFFDLTIITLINIKKLFPLIFTRSRSVFECGKQSEPLLQCQYILSM